LSIRNKIFGNYEKSFFDKTTKGEIIMKRIGIFIIFVMLAVFAAPACAEIKEGSFSVTPFAGGYLFEGNEDLKETYTVGLRAGYNFTENLGLEGFLYYLPTKVKEAFDADVNMYGYGIEGIYHFMPDGRLVPFVALGVGGIYYNSSAGMYEKNKLAVDYGAGLKYFITDDIALRADVRHVLPLKDNYNDLLVTLGVNFTFGGEKKKIAEAKYEEPPAPVQIIMDSDKDGVQDNLDRCPGTPAGVAVDRDGCPPDSDNDGVADYLDRCPGTPAGAAVDKDGCPLDSDKDGVIDNLDRCPGTAAGVAVDKEGCPLDSDNDGVADYLDKCPGTPAGIAVDKDGCPLPAPVIKEKIEVQEKVSITLNVEFDTAKAVVKKKYHEEIKKIADFMEAHPETNVAIEGHTDNVDIYGEPQRNVNLSQSRADSIRQYLIDEFDIDASRISVVGHGSDKPIASNDTVDGRKKNRRVEAVIEAVETKTIP
jgi:OOP family OmpA-OmpF porin